MTSSVQAFARHVRTLFTPLMIVMLGLLGTSVAHAQRSGNPPGVVLYDPTIKNIQGVFPFTQTYSVTITSPSNLVAPSTVSFAVQPTPPAGVTAATALSYLAFFPASLTFTSPNQAQTVQVTFTGPATIVPGSYAYQWKTSSTWNVDASGYTDIGSSINATVTAAALPSKPAVSISTPANGSIITTTSLPVGVPFAFTVTNAGTVIGNITAVDVLLDGVSITSTLALGGLNSPTVNGTGTLSVALPGLHTITAQGTNAGGTAVTSNTFTVIAVAPPVVQINKPAPNATFTYPLGGPLPVVPFSFTGTSGYGNITSLTAYLNGSSTPLALDSTTGLNTALVATGTVADLVAAGAVSGVNTITVVATNPYGTSSQVTQRFYLGTPPTATISSPAANATFVYTVGDPALSIPFVCGGASTTPGAIIRSLTATLNGNPIALTTGGVGVLGNASGSATLSLSTGGSYLLAVTATDDFGTATTTSSFSITVVSPLPPPPDVTIGTPADGSSITVTTLPVTVPFTFHASASGVVPAPITAVAASLDGGTPFVPTSIGGLQTTSVDASGSLVITTPGMHTLVATADNSAGTGSDNNSFTIVLNVAPPTVTINSPISGSAPYVYKTGSASPVVVPFTFTANSSYGGIRTLTAKVDGVDQSAAFTPAGLNTLTATGAISLPYTTAGAHTVSVTTTDDYGTASATSDFTVVVLTPSIAVTISQPLDGAFFDVPVGSLTANVPFTFKATTDAAFVVESVSASIDGVLATISTASGANTPAETASGTLANLAPGVHTLLVTANSSGLSATAKSTFTVRSFLVVPPSVVIYTPAVGSSYSRSATGPAISVPLTFTGTSNMLTGTISKLTASLTAPGGSVSTLTVSSSNLNQKSSDGAAPISVTAAGTYTILVTATDAFGTASTTRTFTVSIEQPKSVSGVVFFDANTNAARDAMEFGLGGVTVNLVNSLNQAAGTTVTAADGSYSFTGVTSGAYTVATVPAAGFRVTTTPVAPAITVAAAGGAVSVPAIGLGMDFTALRGMAAGGLSLGFWKNNLDKAISGKTAGIQVSPAALTSYTKQIGGFALAPYDNITMKQASAIMGSTSSASTDLLSKQLLPAEYNYMNAGYIGGNKTLTFCFVWWGEWVLSHPSSYPASYLTWTQQWMDAYNNSHGGLVNGPL